MLREVKVNGHVLNTYMPSVEENLQEIKEVLSLDMNYVPIDIDWVTYGYVGMKELDNKETKFKFITTDNCLYIVLGSFDIVLVNGEGDQVVLKEILDKSMNIQTIKEESPLYVYENAYVYVGKCDLELSQASDNGYVKIEFR